MLIKYYYSCFIDIYNNKGQEKGSRGCQRMFVDLAHLLKIHALVKHDTVCNNQKIQLPDTCTKRFFDIKTLLLCFRFALALVSQDMSIKH